MPRRTRLLSRAALSVLFAASAHAGTLSTASWITELSGTPFAVPLTASGTSTATSINVSVAVPPFSGSFFVPQTPSGAILHVKLGLGGNAHLTASPSMAVASKGIPGTVIVMTAMHIPAGVNASMVVVGAQSLFHVPLDVGAAGAFSYTDAIVSGIPITVREQRYAWTVHTQTFTGLTSHGAPLPDLAAMGSFDLTAQGGGTVQLVSPTKIQVTFEAPFLKRNTVSLSTLKLSFVPEPGAALLVGAAALALLRAGARHLRAPRE